MFDQCEGCGGHGPITVELDGHLDTNHENVGGYQKLEGRETHLCAYCKDEFEQMTTVEVTKIAP